jgi:ABC-type sugar transport system permease subunit
MYLDLISLAGSVNDPSKSRVVGNVSWALHPRGVKRASQSGGLGLTIPKNAKNPAAAFFLMQWLTSKDQDKAVTDMGTPWSDAKCVGLSIFASALSNPRVWSSLWTTMQFAYVAVTAEMVSGIALALALEHPVRGLAVFRTLFILPMMIAPIAVGLAWR